MEPSPPGLSATAHTVCAPATLSAKVKIDWFTVHGLETKFALNKVGVAFTPLLAVIVQLPVNAVPLVPFDFWLPLLPLLPRQQAPMTRQRIPLSSFLQNSNFLLYKPIPLLAQCTQPTKLRAETPPDISGEGPILAGKLSVWRRREEQLFDLCRVGNGDRLNNTPTQRHSHYLVLEG
jgi:hypothetical protein